MADMATLRIDIVDGSLAIWRVAGALAALGACAADRGRESDGVVVSPVQTRLDCPGSKQYRRKWMRALLTGAMQQRVSGRYSITPVLDHPGCAVVSKVRSVPARLRRIVSAQRSASLSRPMRSRAHSTS